MDNESRAIGAEGYVEYKLDPVIAQRVRELALGLNGCRRHSWRALAIQVTGVECQYTGKELERLAQWTLGYNQEWEPELVHPNGKSGAW